jgi:hypothetical protein
LHALKTISFSQPIIYLFSNSITNHLKSNNPINTKINHRIPSPNPYTIILSLI